MRAPAGRVYNPRRSIYGHANERPVVWVVPTDTSRHLRGGRPANWAPPMSLQHSLDVREHEPGASVIAIADATAARIVPTLARRPSGVAADLWAQLAPAQ